MFFPREKFGLCYVKPRYNWDIMKALRSFSSFFALLLLVFITTGCGSSTIIVHDLDERDANEILTYLNSRSVEAQKVKAEVTGGGGSAAVKWDITVSSDRANEAMSILNAVGLPRRPEENLLGIFQNPGLVPSETQEQIRYQAGLAAQIASVIRKFDGVIEADVTLSIPKEDPLNPSATKPASAAVYVKHNGVLDDPNSHLESKIRRLVSNSVPNLQFDNVTVVGERTRAGETGFESQSAESAAPEKQLVIVWSLLVAKESLTRFRVIFFSFFVAILILLALLGWLFWKIYPVLKNSGGFLQLFSLHSLKPAEGSTSKPDDKPAVAKGVEAPKTPTPQAAVPKAKVVTPPVAPPPAAPAPEAEEELEEEYEDEEFEDEETDEGTSK